MGKYQRLGTMLEQALEQRGCDADWLAWRCGVGKDAVERWLKGAGRPGLSSLVLLASALVELDRRELLEAGVHPAGSGALREAVGPPLRPGGDSEVGRESQMMKGQYWELAARLQSRLGLRSQEWLGDLCGASQGRISLYLQGARPRLSVLVLMARALDDDPRELARLAGYDPRWALDLYTLHFVLGSEYLDALEEAQAKYIRVREVDGDAQGALEALLGLEAGLRAKMAKRAPGLPGRASWSGSAPS